MCNFNYEFVLILQFFCVTVLKFVFFFLGLCQNGESCSKSVVNSCSDCIKSGPDCVWCQKLVSSWFIGLPVLYAVSVYL